MGFKNKLKNLMECRENSKIYDEYYNGNIDGNSAFFVSRNGSDFTGNMLRIAEEISSGDYGDLKIYVYARQDVKPKIQSLKNNYNLKIHKIITDIDTASRTMHKAKYIFTDSGIPYKYVKRPGQIFTNTWHGTIMKLMGRDNNHERPSMGIIQRSILDSDYLVMPSDYLKDRLLKSFVLEDIYPGKILLEGYPRNSVFFDEFGREEFKERFGLENKEIFIYMPTFKGLVDDRKDEKQKDEVTGYLEKIDESLNDNQILFAKLHPYNTQKIDFSKFNRVKEFPKGFETYDIVNMADCLITDYSSVLFDFAITRRKVIIFNYDEEEYLKDRGLYFPLSDMPFVQAKTVDALIEEMNAPKNYDDEDFIKKFNQYEQPDAVKSICKAIFNGEKCNFETVENDRKNILLYVGDFSNKGNVEMMEEFCRRIDRQRYNVFISFCPWMKNIKESSVELFKDIPDDIGFLPFAYNLIPTVREKLDYNKLFSKRTLDNYNDNLKEFFTRTFKLQYSDLEFRAIVSFAGDDFDQTLIFENSGHDFYMFSKSEKDVLNLLDNDRIFDDLDDLLNRIN